MATQLRTTDAYRLPYRLTADQVERMIDTGIIPEGDDLELVGGVLYKMVKKEPHNYSVGRAAQELRHLLPGGMHVREEKSLRHGKRSLPEPDVAIVAGPATVYRPRPRRSPRFCSSSRSATTLTRLTTIRNFAATPLPGCRFTGSSTCTAEALRCSPSRPARAPWPNSQQPFPTRWASASRLFFKGITCERSMSPISSLRPRRANE